MKGIYLASFKANHPNHQIIYQDIDGKRDLDGDMLTIDLEDYDYIIATPPCNWWSRANYRRDSSIYALSTKLLLPCILYKLSLLGKPFIVENVLNQKKFKEYQLFSIPDLYIYKIGRHVYWSNIALDVRDITQVAKTDYKDGKKRYLSSQSLARTKRQGGDDVHEVIERFIQTIEENYNARH